MLEKFVEQLVGHANNRDLQLAYLGQTVGGIMERMSSVSSVPEMPPLFPPGGEPN